MAICGCLNCASSEWHGNRDEARRLVEVATAPNPQHAGAEAN